MQIIALISTVVIFLVPAAAHSGENTNHCLAKPVRFKSAITGETCTGNTWMKAEGERMTVGDAHGYAEVICKEGKWTVIRGSCGKSSKNHRETPDNADSEQNSLDPSLDQGR